MSQIYLDTFKNISSLDVVLLFLVVIETAFK